jgi:hypothetical protein
MVAVPATKTDKDGNLLTVRSVDENFLVERWVKCAPLLTYLGKFSELTPDKAATILERCVHEELLEKLSKTFPNDEMVQSVIEVQKQKLEDAIIH